MRRWQAAAKGRKGSVEDVGGGKEGKDKRGMGGRFSWW